jgi:hypothetical protein
MSIVQNAGAGEVSTGFYTYTIDQSLRFNEPDAPRLTRSIGTPTDETVWTFSCWLKRSTLNSVEDADHPVVAGGTNASNYEVVGFWNSTDDVIINSTSTGSRNTATSAVFRDLSSWYHLVVQRNDANQVIYINGVAVNTISNASDSVSYLNKSGHTMTVGCHVPTLNTVCFDGYLADVVFVDGTAVAIGSLGETKDGIWVAKDPSGLTFGNNGYYLKFANSGALGTDSAGGSAFATNGLAATDVVPDSPTNNFATLNPLAKGSGTVVFSEGNLKSSHAVSLAVSEHAATFTLPKSGKWYWEAAYTGVAADGSQGILMGILDVDTSTIGLSGNHITTGTGNFIGWYSHNNNISINNTRTDFTTDNVVNQTTGIVSFAIDLDNNHMWVAVNNTYINGTPDFSDGSNKIASPNSTATWLPYFAGNGGATFTWTVNFGQDSANVSSANADSNGIGTFEYAVPSGYLALCSTNLPEITIGPEQDTQADDNFNTVLYTGNNGNLDVTGVGFDPDFVWAKNMDSGSYHPDLYDSVRGNNLRLNSSQTAAEATGFLTFETDGFSLTQGGGINANGNAHVAWNWLAGTAFSNDASATSVGTIDSTGQVNTKAGFSIISYTGNGSSSQTVAHGLSSTPEFLIHKDRDTNSNNNQWNIYHVGAGDDYGYFLTNAFTGAAQLIPTDTTTFELKANLATSNESGDRFIVYCFHSVDGYCKVGSYIGNGNANGSMAFTGFRPVFVLLKAVTGSNNWSMYDNKRDIDNPVRDYLIPNNAAGSAQTDTMDFLSNGFKVRNSGAYINTNGTKYIYLAFADQPFKFANAR